MPSNNVDPPVVAPTAGILDPPPVLTTERLLIRPLEAGDLEACHRLFVDIGWAPAELDEAQNRDRRRTWLDWTIASYREFPRLAQPTYGERAIVERHSGAFVGLIGLVPSLAPFAQLASLGGIKGARFSPEAGLFWALSPAAQGKGLATEAAQAFVRHITSILNLARVVATTEYDNARSIAVMRRLGMRIERNPYPEVGPDWFQVVGIFETDGG
jgi:RimJ/RimL family protein N-acetyltransferase